LNWRIAIGIVNETLSWPDWVQHRALLLPDEIMWNGHRKMHITYQVFDQLCILSFYSDYTFDIDWSLFSRRNGIHPLWPISDEPIAKPFLQQTQESLMHTVDILCDTLNEDFHT
jgi:hypothetical protein